ncbi:putative DNA damage-responsive transcriptional repressor RPH1 [Amylocarpus encephaloides]|uniref:[histone H3]-trimethyl-L-lysine(9) demethylase n=1 Tax=Amylocarpus encephaloides TaxID=45428 RepID=A0A9P7Y8C2_9HELO|nr:putative DNA damage-responsive transcriptional repressor RPH1 [Amylocarpus encephaloides]
MSADVAVAVPTSGPAVEASGLHSPPDSNTKDPSDSELSDLDEEHNEPPSAENETDMEEIEPDYYSDGGVPVFVPTMGQFRDFTQFMKKINKYGMSCGIVKVIPPEEWKATQPRLDDAVRTIRVKEPIKQDIMGTSGTYRQANILHQRSYNLPQWRQLCEQSDHQPPAKRGERRVNQDKPPRSTPRTKAPTNATPSRGMSSRRGRGRPFRGKARGVTVDTEDGGQSTPDRLPTPVSPSVKPEEERAGSVKAELEEEYNEPVENKPRLGSRQAKATVSVSSRRKNNRRERDGKVDEAAFKDFRYELDGDEYTPERCAELERAYWKTLTYAPPLYGADMPGTLFDERTKAWNLGKLDNILDVMGSKIPGVNTAYLYLGMWKATFAWHLEDVDLYSINYLHFGAPKQWYSIAQGDARRFEAAMKTVWPTDAKACDQFLRHKTFLISPSHLAQNFNIKVNKIVHKPGEFVITFPYGYHSGYNLGYNCAEAVNFGLESWLEYGRVAKKCDCDQAQDSVWINVHELERKLRGEETEYEETDEEEEDGEDEDNENETSVLVASTPGGLKTKAPSKKRKRPVNVKGADSSSKRIRVRIKAPAKEPCVLCPNDIPSEPLLSTEDGNQAHKICAQYIPETDIDGDKVIDIRYIAKGRLELKCNYCRSKKGACFQCSRKKCTRAYHATCAAAAGVFVEQGEIPVFGEDGTEYKEWGIEFSCRFHRIKRDKKLDSDALADSERVHKAGADLNAGEVCQVQYYRGDIFAGAVVENRKDEEMVLLDILPRGHRVEVEYKWILLPDPADFHLVKPSANAIPMPKSRKDKQSLNTTKRMADDLPRAEDPFVEGHTWAEFNHEKIPVNPFQVKIDFRKDNQTWFYLACGSAASRFVCCFVSDWCQKSMPNTDQTSQAAFTKRHCISRSTCQALCL